jgi:hypothetical protein
MPGKSFMKLALKTVVLSAGVFLSISAFGYFFWYKPKFDGHSPKGNFTVSKASGIDERETLHRIKQKASLVKDYIAGHDFDTKYCFLVDMRRPSGKNRFFVYNLEKDQVELAGLVTHGSGSDNGSAELSFSNTANSKCTSLGRYKIGKSYYGKFGLAFKLYGLDNTNNRAFDRFVVLHALGCVPNAEIDPLPICESWGCPTVSPEFLLKLNTYLVVSLNPVLLWIYY